MYLLALNAYKYQTVHVLQSMTFTFLPVITKVSIMYARLLTGSTFDTHWWYFSFLGQ